MDVMQRKASASSILILVLLILIPFSYERIQYAVLAPFAALIAWIVYEYIKKTFRYSLLFILFNVTVACSIFGLTIFSGYESIEAVKVFTALVAVLISMINRNIFIRKL